MREDGVSTKEAEDFLDEQAKSTRKTSHHTRPFSYNEEPGRGHNKKGTRKIKQGQTYALENAK